MYWYLITIIDNDDFFGFFWYMNETLYFAVVCKIIYIWNDPKTGSYVTWHIFSFFFWFIIVTFSCDEGVKVKLKFGNLASFMYYEGCDHTSSTTEQALLGITLLIIYNNCRSECIMYMIYMNSIDSYIYNYNWH